jgi:hypothetical protein
MVKTPNALTERIRPNSPARPGGVFLGTAPCGRTLVTCGGKARYS